LCDHDITQSFDVCEYCDDMMITRRPGPAFVAQASNVMWPAAFVGAVAQVLLPMAGLFDAAKELARLNKQRTKLQKVMPCMCACAQADEVP
jgi:hypothetical protein